MTQRDPRLPADLRIEPLKPEVVADLQKMCTLLELPKYCLYKVCKISGRCSTREVMCWQVAREHINPLIQKVLALQWLNRIEAGEDVDIAPARADGYQRIAARIERRKKRPRGRARKTAAAAASAPKENAS